MAIDRRAFLHAAAVAGGGVVFCGCDLVDALAAGTHDAVSLARGGALQQAAGRSFGQARAAAGRRELVIGGKRVRTIDMHCHSYVAETWDLVRNRPEARGGTPNLASSPMALDVRTVETRLGEMDRQGIDVHAISSHQAQYFYWAEPELAEKIVKVQNDKLAEVCAAHPDRFVALGAVAVQHPDLAAGQMDHAVKTLGMRGFMIGGSINGEELANPRFDPFWRKAEDLGAVVFIHPSGFAEGAKRFAGNGWLGNTIGNPLETTVALSHIIFDGLLDRFPGVRILGGHGGGYLPSYIGRSDKCHTWNDGCRKMARKPSEYLRGPQLYFDSVVYSPENMRHLVATVGASQVVVGTDFQFEMASTTPVDDILNTPGLTPEEQIAILGGNAARLLKLS